MVNSSVLQSASFKDQGVCWAKEFASASISATYFSILHGQLPQRELMLREAAQPPSWLSSRHLSRSWVCFTASPNVDLTPWRGKPTQVSPASPTLTTLPGSVAAEAVGRCLGILKPFQPCSALCFLFFRYCGIFPRCKWDEFLETKNHVWIKWVFVLWDLGSGENEKCSQRPAQSYILAVKVLSRRNTKSYDFFYRVGDVMH